MKKKALFISSRPIYPIIGGDQIRTEQQLDLLSSFYDVDVVFLTELSNPETIQYYKYAKDVNFFHRSKLHCALGTLRFLINKLPLQVNYYFDYRLARFVRDNAHKYDVIFCNNIRTGEYARNIRGPKKIMDFVDAISMNYDKARKHSFGLKKLFYVMDFYRCKDYEQTIINEFDACSIISNVDKSYLKSCQK